MRHVIAIVDANEKHRRAVEEAVAPSYRVEAYGDATNAIAGMHLSKPKVIVVGQQVGTGHGANQHHERLDGSGYPRALGAKDLNRLARMASIIDVFTSLTDRKPYKWTTSAEAAFEVMTTEMASQLDQELLAKFRDILLQSGEVDGLGAHPG